MTKTKQSSIDSKKYLDEHRETTRSELGKIKAKDDLSDKQKNALIKLLLDDVREEQSTDEFKKHAEVRKADYKKISELVIERVGDPKKVTKEDITNAVDFFYGKSEKPESKTEKSESPHKALEKERKTAAIAELERLGMKTDENVEKINAIQFLDDKILIGNTPWAYENMVGGQGTFRKETNRWYYNFEERKAEAKKQRLVLPRKEDFENTLKALPGEYSERYWYKGGNILSIILGESMTGYCGSDGYLHGNGIYGYLGSVSEYYEDHARFFIFDEDKGGLNCDYKDGSFFCRPLVKNS